MPATSDLTTQFTQKLRAQVADALESVDFSAANLPHGLHLRGESDVSLSWSDRVATLRRVQLMRRMAGIETGSARRDAA